MYQYIKLNERDPNTKYSISFKELLEVYPETGIMFYKTYKLFSDKKEKYNDYIYSDSTIRVDKFNYRVKNDSRVELMLIDRKILHRTGKPLKVFVENGEICNLSKNEDQDDIRNLRKEILWHKSPDLNFRYCILDCEEENGNRKMDLFRKELEDKARLYETISEECKIAFKNEFGKEIQDFKDLTEVSSAKKGSKEKIITSIKKIIKDLNFSDEYLEEKLNGKGDLDFFSVWLDLCKTMPSQSIFYKTFVDENKFKFSPDQICPEKEALENYVKQKSDEWYRDKASYIDLNYCKMYLTEFAKKNLKGKDFYEIEKFFSDFEDFSRRLDYSVGNDLHKKKYPTNVDEGELDGLVRKYLSNSLLHCDYFDWIIINSIVGFYEHVKTYSLPKVGLLDQIFNKSGVQKLNEISLKLFNFYRSVNSAVFSVNDARDIYRDLHSNGCAMPSFICAILDKRISEGKTNITLPEKAKTPQQLEGIYLDGQNKKVA